MTAKGRSRVTVPSTTTGTDSVLDELLGKDQTDTAGSGPRHDPPPPAPIPAPATKTDDPSARPRMTIYVADEVQAAARAAVYWTNNKPDGFENLSDLVEAAIIEKVRDLADLYNEGQPFSPMPAKRLRRGRPLRRSE